ncbi:MAG: hypothetical protein A3D21_02505 [Nitrospirae bacterium RIFCSPHIGHO2_02_FULL_42_12]|nr:MAG: hypothetical protein A3D21_02505 [Nitrospirae bacterium RIFCSPHIGHO2_02_FULL_42_12]
MNKVIVAKTSIVTAMGNSLEEMWPGLSSGRSAIKAIHRFKTDMLGYHDGACVDGLRINGGENIICELISRALNNIKPVPRDTLIIWTGIKGDAPFIESKAEGREGRPPYLANHYREWVCNYLGIPNIGIEINAACASSTVGLAIGAQLISEGSYSSVLVCAADIVSRFIFTGFSALRGLSATKCRPFDRDRDGLSLGDGAAAVLLTNMETAGRMGYTPLARLSGWGIANDANHITGPARDGRGLINSIRSAITQAGLSHEEVDAYCAHGTGTTYNDAMELTAVEAVFGSRLFPFFSVKGAIGHTLGAAGAIEAAISIHALAERWVPPTSGLVNPEERAKGRASDKGQPISGNNILTSNSGFGGCNAALIFEGGVKGA